VTLSPESLVNLFEPQLGQIGQERAGSIKYLELGGFY
jgi:hypothetical protein|tara:strand:+ start:428 stop:538 length:111 start_codon:yes stop_codon:yes gene_type:complete